MTETNLGSELAGFEPCPNSGACCALRRADLTERCLPNGLCEVIPVLDRFMETRFWRGFCSDSEWNEGTCLNICKPGVRVRSSLACSSATH